MMKKLFLFAVAVSWVGAVSCLAQTTTNDDVLINGDNGTVNLKVTGNNGAVFTGTYGSGTIPATGAGTRMMWYPKKAAFRVGKAEDDQWDDANIGNYSFATGLSTWATGEGSVAMGTYTQAFGNAVTSLGAAYTSGDYSVGLGLAYVEGTRSVAIGFGAEVWADYGTAIGSYAFAHGERAMAFGVGAVAAAFGSTALGHYNVEDTSGNETSWVLTDELLVVGNGTGTGGTPTSNALVIRKNANMRTGGQVEAKGIRTAPRGDLSMGSFTAGDNPDDLDAALKYPGE